MNREHLERIIALRHALHAAPELSMQEYRTKETLMEFLRTHTKLEVEDRGRWFYAHASGPKPKARPIAFRADFDALPIPEKLELPWRSRTPGVSHKCGHDGHSAALAGLALELSGTEVGRDVYLIFQHGEEIGGGGKECAQLIREKGIGSIYAFHNWSGYPEGSALILSGPAQCASEGLTVHFQGREAHASQPEDGKNPVRAAARLALYVDGAPDLQPHEGLLMATLVQLRVGSKNFGIAAGEGEVSMTLRAHWDEELSGLRSAIQKEAVRLAREEGLTVSWEQSDIFPETINDARCVELAARAAERIGIPVLRSGEPFRASEDFGYYQRECRGAMLYIGNGEDYPPIHTAEYDFNDRILPTAVDLFRELVKEG